MKPKKGFSEEELAEKFHQEVKQILNSKDLSALSATRNLKTDPDKVPTTKNEEHLKHKYYHNNDDLLQDTWTKFSVKHQISPFSINNNSNVQNGKKKYMHSTNDNGQRVQRYGKVRGSEGSKLGKCNLATSAALTIKDAVRNTLLCSVKMTIILLKIIAMTILTLVLFYCLFTLHKPTQALISRNTQDLIYPFMRALRLLSIPVINKFPILTSYYEESCLISNPFYAPEEMDCWPCEGVRHVIDLTGFSNFSSAYHHSGIPFVVKDAFPNEIDLDEIRKIVSSNQELLRNTFVDTTLVGLTTVEDVFSPRNIEAFNSKDFHLEWYINRVTIARLWRAYFPKPYFIPLSTEISVQHFLFIDHPASKTYKLPLTEFSNVFLTQASGSRSIVLIPTEHCRNHCKVVSAILEPKDVLFYNWLFWRPMSVAADSTSLQQSTSVTYIGSFY